MQSIREPPAFHRTASEFVNNDNLAGFQHIMRVTSKKPVGAQRLIDVVQQPDIFNVIKRCLANHTMIAKQGFCMLDTGLT